MHGRLLRRVPERTSRGPPDASEIKVHAEAGQVDSDGCNISKLEMSGQALVCRGTVSGQAHAIIDPRRSPHGSTNRKVQRQSDWTQHERAKQARHDHQMRDAATAQIPHFPTANEQIERQIMNPARQQQRVDSNNPRMPARLLKSPCALATFVIIRYAYIRARMSGITKGAIVASPPTTARESKATSQAKRSSQQR